MLIILLYLRTPSEKKETNIIQPRQHTPGVFYPSSRVGSFRTISLTRRLADVLTLLPNLRAIDLSNAQNVDFPAVKEQVYCSLLSAPSQ